jgi:YggT family protein
MLLYRLVDGLFTVYTVALAAAIFSSWFPDIEDYAIVRFIRWLTDPYLSLFRRIIPPIGMLDISPIAAFFVLQLLEAFVKRLLFL